MFIAILTAFVTPHAAALPLQESATYVLEERHPAGLALVTELRTSHEFLLTDMYKQMADREPLPYNAAGSVSSDYYARWRDDHGIDTQIEQPLIKRHYQELRLTGRATLTLPGMPTRPENAIFGSNFQGRTITFVWNPEEETYGHCYSYYDGPEEALAGLKADANLAAVLPAGPVAVGERWTLSAEQTQKFLTSGGDLRLLPQRESVLARSMKLGVGATLSDVLGSEVFGQCEVVLRAVETDEAGDQIAVLDVEKLAVQSLGERRDLYEELMSEDEKKEPSITDTVTIDTRLSGGGTVRWSVSQGHLVSAQLGGDETSELRITKIWGEEPNLIPVSETASYKGLWKLSLVVRPPKESDTNAGATPNSEATEKPK